MLATPPRRRTRPAIEGQPGKLTLVVLGRPPALQPGLPLEAGKTIDVGDVTVNEPR